MRKLFYIIILFVFCSVISCTTTKKVTEKVVLTDTVYVKSERVDTIVKFASAKDSVYEKEKDSTDTKMQGDTLVITKYKYIYKYVQSKNAVKDKSVSTEKNDSTKARVVYIDREKTKMKPYVPKWVVLAFLFSLLGAYVLGRIKN